MKCEYTCKFREDFCDEHPEFCRIYNSKRLAEVYKEQMRKESEAEISMIHQLNDIGLSKVIERWHEGKDI